MDQGNILALGVKGVWCTNKHRTKSHVHFCWSLDVYLFFKGEIVLWMPGKGQAWIGKIDNRSTKQYIWIEVNILFMKGIIYNKNNAAANLP